MVRRLLSLALIVIMVFALVGCGDDGPKVVKITLNAEDSEAILAAAGIHLPDAETAAGANSTVRFFCWYDPFQNYDEDEIVNTGYWTFQERYNSEIEWIEVDYFERNDTLAQLVLADNPPDFTVAGTSNTATFPMSCIKGMYQPVDDYIDYTDPLWEGMADAAEYFNLAGKNYAIVTDLSYKDVVPYNRRVIEEWGFDDPAELYYNDEWTWDVFYEMCIDFSDPDENRYALDGWYYVNGICEQSTGITIISKNEEGDFISNLDNPIIEVAENLIYDLVKNECTYREGTDYWAGRNDMQYGAGVNEGDCLFWICDRSGFTLPVEEMNQIWGDIEAGEIMFVPLPRYQDGDGIYYLNATPSGYMMCKGAENPEGVALLAACQRFKVIDPTVIDIDIKQLKEKYLWNDEMLEMDEICKQLVQDNVVMFYTGDLPTNLNNIYNNIDWGINRGGAGTSWAQIKESNREALDYYLQELNAEIEKFNETGQSSLT